MLEVPSSLIRINQMELSGLDWTEPFSDDPVRNSNGKPFGSESSV